MTGKKLQTMTKTDEKILRMEEQACAFNVDIL
jgi:hypothetical protein